MIEILFYEIMLLLKMSVQPPLTVSDVRQILIKYKHKFTIAAGNEHTRPTVYYDSSLDVDQLRELVGDSSIIFIPRGPQEVITSLPLPKEHWL